MSKKKVAVIGAGAAGLASIKSALDEGLQPTAFEKEPWLGGIWRYIENESRLCVANSTITNTSKHITCFSDFPMPKEFPNYLPHKLVQKYFEMYAKRFDLTAKIRFQTEVTSVTRSADHDSTGRWVVCYRAAGEARKREDTAKQETFDFVMICTGASKAAFVPSIQGLDSFEGDVIHSKAYKSWKGFEGKRVLVVGLGNTGGDIACELSRHAQQVYLSTRSGAWVSPRLGHGGVPVDLTFFTRALQRSRRLLPRTVLARMFTRTLSSTFRPCDFGLQATCDPTKRPIVINDELPHRIITGSLIVKSDVAAVSGREVFFIDGSQLSGIDTIILATGYQMVFAVIEQSNLDPRPSCYSLYKYVFPAKVDMGTMAIIGAIKVMGPVLPVEEMQARWACRIFTGACSLPEADVMAADISERQRALDHQFSHSTWSHHLIADAISYMDEIGCLIGVMPDLLRLLWRDPGLALRCFFGPCVPAQYRLVGPGAWDGARDAIFGVQESMALPLQTRKVQTQGNDGVATIPSLLVAALVLFLAFLLFHVPC